MENLKRAVLMALKNVVDPEVGLDIVTMGLVYDIAINEAGIRVALTLTSRGCPLGETIGSMARESLDGIAGGRAVTLALVWDPPWSPHMITSEGREALRI
ncbi:MAG: metal-sulfur cluster assembly factor [Elusimicrobia bacterium]|nr:metal-sulfur cluster assembly factor [Elusimicrobiota bacterium]MDE2238248.1 metal-sulfur cluster assembly factor [Elusimicrobiota bacterium]MDE2424836.1 metal-sulfur cluster assembly factor [Elusimicrobiota bacterium]